MEKNALEVNKTLVRRFAEAVSGGDHALLDELLTPNFVRHCQATPDVTVRTCEDFKRFEAAWRITCPDQLVTMDSLVAEGDWVGFFGRYSGTQKGPMGPFPASGRFMEVDIAGMFRIAEGKIAELWITWDNLAGLVQLGHFPPPAAQ